MNWPITVWPGAICNDWFGVIAFYGSVIGLGISVGLVIAAFVYIACNWNDPSKW